jgi:hypothetical protein
MLRAAEPPTNRRSPERTTGHSRQDTQGPGASRGCDATGMSTTAPHELGGLQRAVTLPKPQPDAAPCACLACHVGPGTHDAAIDTVPALATNVPRRSRAALIAGLSGARFSRRSRPSFGHRDQRRVNRRVRHRRVASLQHESSGHVRHGPQDLQLVTQCLSQAFRACCGS